MKKLIALIMFIIVLILLTSCNATSRHWGGTQTIELPKGQKLINVTWKDNDLWFLTRDFKDGEEAEAYKFIEDSNYGMFEGTVNIIEIK